MSKSRLGSRLGSQLKSGIGSEYWGRSGCKKARPARESKKVPKWGFCQIEYTPNVKFWLTIMGMCQVIALALYAVVDVVFGFGTVAYLKTYTYLIGENYHFWSMTWFMLWSAFAAIFTVFIGYRTMINYKVVCEVGHLSDVESMYHHLKNVFIFCFVSLSVLIFFNYLLQSELQSLEKLIEKRLEEVMENYDNDPSKTNAINALQIDYECCGKDGPGFWLKIKLAERINYSIEAGYDIVPKTCCKLGTRECNFLKISTAKDKFDSRFDELNRVGCKTKIKESMDWLAYYIFWYRFFSLGCVELLMLVVRAIILGAKSEYRIMETPSTTYFPYWYASFFAFIQFMYYYYAEPTFF